MKQRLAFLALVFPLLALMSCSQVLYAQVFAQVTDPSVYAELNMTMFTQPPGPGGEGDSNLRMRFSNDSDDQLDLVLAPPAGGNFVPGTYYITTAGPSLSFSYSTNGQNIPLTLAIDGGFINLNVISIVEGIILRAEGDLHLNFAAPNHGSCTGTFVYATPS